MKRACLLIFCLILMLSLAATAGATETGSFETAGDLWDYWCENDCVPDFITGVWSTDGSHENLTFGLVPGEEGQTAKALILSWIRDDSSVSFETQTWSRNYLLSILDDLDAYFEKDIGFTAAGLDDCSNLIFIELHMDYKSNPDSLAAVKELEEKYGSAVSIYFSETIIQTTLDLSSLNPTHIMTVQAAPPAASPLPWLFMVCTLLLCAIVLTERRRIQLLTHLGTLEAPLTTRQVAQQVRSAAPEVPKTLDSRINAALDDLPR